MQFSNWNFDPVELRMLKQQLANLNCNCLNCEKYNKRYTKINQNTGVQVHPSRSSVGRFSQGTSGHKIERPKVDKANSNNLINVICKDVICPSCRYIVEFLRGSLNKILKDEESETISTTRCDKSTDKFVNCLEKTTSITKKCKSYCDVTKKTSNEFIETNSTEKGNCDRVSFKDSIETYVFVDSEKSTLANSEQQEMLGLADSKPLNYESCLCLEKFIDSIKPPVTE